MYNSDNHTFKPIMLMFIAETISNTPFKLNFKKNLYNVQYTDSQHIEN